MTAYTDRMTPTHDLYNPEAFRVDDRAVLSDVIDQQVFATLVSNGADGPNASHLPVLLDRTAGPRGTLRAHLARANGHWRALDGEPVLVVFQGPDHYVTPSWYPSKADGGKVVPTWNYVVVHARGRAAIRHDPEHLRRLVGALTGRMESARAEPWSVDDAPADFIDRMLAQIVGLDVEIESLEGKFKLGQNRPEADRAGLAAGIESELASTALALAQYPGLRRPDGG